MSDENPKTKAVESKVVEPQIPPAPVTKDDIQTQIEAHSKVLQELSERGRKIQTQQQTLQQQLNQIVIQSNERVGAIKALQGLATNVKEG